MIKVKIEESIVPKNNKPYPKIMISRTAGTIVLFKEEHKGTVLRVSNSPQNCLTVGQYIETWGMGGIERFGICGYGWEDYNFPITLENE